MYQMIENSIWGSFATNSKRHVSAYNPYVEGYEPDKPHKFITCLDANRCQCHQSPKSSYRPDSTEGLPQKLAQWAWMKPCHQIGFLALQTTSCLSLPTPCWIFAVAKSICHKVYSFSDCHNFSAQRPRTCS